MKIVKSWIITSLIALLSLLPLPMLRVFGRALGKMLWRLNGRSRKVTETNLQICFPTKGRVELEKLAQKSLRHLGMMAFELGISWRWPAEKLLARIEKVEGLELLEQAQQGRKGLLVLAPHLGNWEILGYYFAKHFKMTVLYQPSEYAALDKMIYRARGRSGASVVATDIRGVKALLKALKRNEMTAILPDQVPDRSGGEYAPFFGVNTLTATLATNLIGRTGAAVIVAALLRQDNGSGYKLVFKAVSDDIYSDDTVVSLTALNSGVESIVLEAPEQYQWEYKRFRRVPAGDRQHYKSA